MASTGEAVTYRELDARSNRLAHLFRKRGLKRLDHYSIFMENNNRYLEACGAGERSGLFFTCVNSYLTPGELAYILVNSELRILITSKAKLDVAREAIKECPKIELCIVADGEGESDRIVGLQQATAGLPSTPIADECSAPRCFIRPAPPDGRKASCGRCRSSRPRTNCRCSISCEDLALPRRHDLSVAGAALSLGAAGRGHLTIKMGGTAIIMENFDPERYLQLIEHWGITHTQLVPTMFSRMLKLPEEVRKRYDLSSLEIAIHAAAPCPAAVKEDMIKWWGPIIHEYYGATEGLGFTACNSEEWLAHRGTVGRVLLGDLHILDENMQPARKARPARCGSRPPRHSNISTIRPRPGKRARKTAA